MSEIKLLPCPFCGSRAEIHKMTNGQYYVDCSLDNGFCHVIPKTGGYDTPEEAAEAWNRREGEQNE